ncbi:hypothetical protein RCL1_008995 [Eukaryota sp. TZLM3-RCL]
MKPKTVSLSDLLSKSPPLPEESFALENVSSSSLLFSKFIESLSSAKWKDRVEALDEMSNIATQASPSDVTSSFVSSICVILNTSKCFSNINTQVVGKSLSLMSILLSKLTEEDPPSSHLLPLLIPFTIDKVIEPRSKSSAIDLTNCMCRVFTPGPVFDAIYSSYNSIKNPKVQAELLSIIADVAEQFSLVSINIQKLIDFCNTAVDSPNAQVRQSVLKILCNMRKILGPNISNLLTNFKANFMSTIEAEFAKIEDTGSDFPPIEQPKATTTTIKSVPAQPPSGPNNKAEPPKTASKPTAKPAATTRPTTAPATSTTKKSTASSGSTSSASVSLSDLLSKSSSLPDESSATEIISASSLPLSSHLASLTSAKWKDRVEALDQLTTCIEESAASSVTSPMVSSFCVLLNVSKCFSNINTQVVGKSFSLVALLLSKLPDEEQANPHVIPVVIPYLIDKVVEPRSKTGAVDLLHAVCRNYAPGPVFDAIYSSYNSIKNPKVQAELLSIIADVAEQFSLVSINIQKLIDFCNTAVDSPNAQVRQSVLKILCNMRKILGPNISNLLSNFKANFMSTIEAEFAKIEDTPQGPPKEPVVTIKASAAKAVEVSTAVPTLVTPKTDISSKITSKLLAKLNSRNWKERAAGIAELEELLSSVHDSIEPNLGPDLPNALRLRLGDSNANIATQTATLINRIVSAIGTPAVDKFTKVWFPAIVGCLSVNKPLLRTAASEAIENWTKHVTLDRLLSYLPELMSAESVLQKRDVITFFATHLDSCTSVPPNLLPVVKVLFARAQDGDKDVRHAAETALLVVAKFIGGSKLVNMTKRFPVAEQDRLRGLVSKLDRVNADETLAEGAAPAPVPSTTTTTQAPVPQQAEPPVETSKPAVGVSRRPATASTRPKTAVPRSDKPQAESASLLILEATSFAEACEPKERRWIKEKKGVTRWTQPDAVVRSKAEFTEQLRQQVSMIANQRLIELMMSTNLADIQSSIETLSHHLSTCSQSTPMSSANITLVSHLDVILRWCSLKLTEEQPNISRRILELLSSLVSHLKHVSYHFSDYEVAATVPFVLDTLRSGKEPVKHVARDLMAAFTFVCPASRIFVFIIESIANSTKNIKFKCELLDLACFFISKHGKTISSPSRLLPIIRDVAGEPLLKPSSVNFVAIVCSTWSEEISLKGLVDTSFIDLVNTNISQSNQTVANTSVSARSSVDSTVDHVAPASPQSTVHKLPPTPPTPQPIKNLDDYGPPAHVPSQLSQSAVVPSFADVQSHSVLLAGSTPKLPSRSTVRPMIYEDLGTQIDKLSTLSDLGSLDTCQQAAAVTRVISDLTHDLDPVAFNPHVDRLIEKTTVTVIKCFQTMISIHNESQYQDDSAMAALSTLSEVSMTCLRVINAVFVERLNAGKLVSASQLKHFICSVCTFVVHGPFRGLGNFVASLIRQVNRVMLSVLDGGNRNVLFSVLLNLSQPLISKSQASRFCNNLSESEIEQFEGLILKCLTKLTTSLIDWESEKHIDYDLLLRDVHLFLISYSREKLADRSDMKLKLIKTLLEKLVNSLGSRIQDHLSLVPPNSFSPLKDYIEDLLEYNNGGQLISDKVCLSPASSLRDSLSKSDASTVVLSLLEQIKNNTSTRTSAQEQLVLFAKRHSDFDVVSMVHQHLPENLVEIIVPLLPSYHSVPVPMSPAPVTCTTTTTENSMTNIASRFRDRLQQLQAKNASVSTSVTSTQLLSRLEALKANTTTIKPVEVVPKPLPTTEQLHDTFSELLSMHAQTPQPSARVVVKPPEPVVPVTDASSRVALLKERIMNLKR